VEYFISGDGTVFSLVSESTITFHAPVSNSVALAGETGHNQGQSNPRTPSPTNLWQPLNGVGDRNNAHYDDLPGLKLWWRHQSFDEMVVAWWTTARFAGPQRDAVTEPEEIFSEQHYRSWALLARYAAEKFLIPRNFPRDGVARLRNGQRRARGRTVSGPSGGRQPRVRHRAARSVPPAAPASGPRARSGPATHRGGPPRLRRPALDRLLALHAPRTAGRDELSPSRRATPTG
jgi:hypothetical protein